MPHLYTLSLSEGSAESETFYPSVIFEPNFEHVGQVVEEWGLLCWKEQLKNYKET